MRKHIAILMILILSSICWADRYRVPDPNITPSRLDKDKFWSAGGTYNPPPIKILVDCQGNGKTYDEIYSVSGTGASIAIDANEYKLGQQCLSWVIGAQEANYSTATITLPALTYPILAGNSIGVWLKVDDISNLNFLYAKLYRDNSYGWQCMIMYEDTHAKRGIIDNTWKLVWLRIDEFFTAIGGETTSVYNDYPVYKVAFYGRSIDGGNATTIKIGGVLSYKAPKAGLILNWDDGYSSVYELGFLPFKVRKWGACVMACGKQINNSESGYLTMVQCQEMYASDWDICGHTFTHQTCSATTPDANVISEMAASKKWLLANGFQRSANFMAWPGNWGDCVSHIAGDIADKWFKIQRASSTRVAYGYDTAGNTTTLSSWIPNDWGNVRYIGLETVSRTNFAAVGGTKDKIDDAISKKLLIVLYGHKITEAGTSGSISTQYFNDMVTYLDQKVADGSIEILTFSDWYNRMHYRLGGMGLGPDNDFYLTDGNSVSSFVGSQ